MTAAAKRAISKLTPPQKHIFLSYVEMGSYAAVARKYKVSTPTARAYIMDIKALIKNYIKAKRLRDDDYSDMD